MEQYSTDLFTNGFAILPLGLALQDIWPILETSVSKLLDFASHRPDEMRWSDAIGVLGLSQRQNPQGGTNWQINLTKAAICAHLEQGIGGDSARALSHLIDMLSDTASSLARDAIEYGSRRSLDYGLPHNVVGNKLSTLRINKYVPGNDTGVSPLIGREHVDFGLITLIFQMDQPGLQCLNREGEWISIPESAKQPVALVGELLSLWSGGAIPVCKHRVAANSRNVGRISIAFFAHPDPELEIPCRIIPNELLCDEDRRSIRAEEYIKRRVQYTAISHGAASIKK